MKTHQFIVLICMLICSSFIHLQAQNKKAAKFYKRGVAAYDDHKLIQATVDLTKAISYYPAYADAYYLRGRSFLRLNQKEIGRQDLKEAIHLDSMKMEPYVVLARELRIINAMEEAIAYLDAMVARNADHKDIMHFEKALIFEAAKDLNQALYHYEIVVQIMDPNKGATYNDILEYAKKKIKELK